MLHHRAGVVTHPVRRFDAHRQISFLATVQEIGHGRDITWTPRAKEAPEHIRQGWLRTSWIVEVDTTGTRDRKLSSTKHLFLTSLRTTPEASLQLVKERWRLEGWHWIRDTQLHEEAHRYRGDGAGVMGSLRTAALNLLRLGVFPSIRAALQSVT